MDYNVPTYIYFSFSVEIRTLGGRYTSYIAIVNIIEVFFYILNTNIDIGTSATKAIYTYKCRLYRYISSLYSH